VYVVKRQEREILDQDLLEWILKTAGICRIALCDRNAPYIIPMNFVYHPGCLYLHSATDGKKIDLIKRNNCVGFAVDLDCELVAAGQPCAWSMKYYSVVGHGRAYFIESIQEKRKALDTLVCKYAGREIFTYEYSSLDCVTVIKVAIEKMTGKKSGY
jgi:hypothetical protein